MYLRENKKSMNRLTLVALLMVRMSIAQTRMSSGRVMKKEKLNECSNEHELREGDEKRKAE